MKNLKRIGVALSLTLAIALGGFVYASDFSTPEEGYGHCYESTNKIERQHRMRHHKDDRHHRMQQHGMQNYGRHMR